MSELRSYTDVLNLLMWSMSSSDADNPSAGAQEVRGEAGRWAVMDV